ncbi:MAG: M23 family metallopeptidase [Desulfobacterales bacterium]|nr:M23 family metallopeptidase [Desulfobacterales bacterium]
MKRWTLFLIVSLASGLFCTNCSEKMPESTCANPIDARHRGLQWLSSGPLGQHLAIDFVAPEGTEVRAIADGRIEHNYQRMGYYGGCDGTEGPVLITRHPGGSNGSYAVQYGHVLSDLDEDEPIYAGEVIGTVINYIPCCDTPKGCPHVHFAIWDSPTEHPTSGMGYGPPRHFADPDWFFKNNLCNPAME